MARSKKRHGTYMVSEFGPSPKMRCRLLGSAGRFLTGRYSELQIARFNTLEAATLEADAAPNRRNPSSIMIVRVP